MSEHYDALETRSAEQRAVAMRQQLPELIGHAKVHAPYYGKSLADIDPRAVTDLAALARLPVLRKSALIELQRATPPLGGLNTEPLSGMLRVFQSPGPIYEVHSRDHDGSRTARSLFAAGFRPGDLIFNTFAYHFTPAGHMLEAGATALGCTVFPAGTGQSELQAQAISDLQPAGYIGTPSFLNILLDKAAELDLDSSSLKHASVSAEPFPPSLRASFSERGIAAYQTYGTAELGLVAYETAAVDGLVVAENAIVEIVRPGTGDPVPDGEVGEVVVTVLDNPAYPLIRFATGDLSAVLAGPCPTGRTNRRITGWMGRADQTTKVRGMFVHPEQVSEVIKRHPEISRARLVVTSENHRDILTLRCEIRQRADGLQEAIAATLRDVCKLRGDVELVGDGELPNDGKVIADERDFA
ncbi:MAG: AMP-binding protein [Ottowia sp.]|nr:AMP-binding protein [Ottowia sp.]